MAYWRREMEPPAHFCSIPGLGANGFVVASAPIGRNAALVGLDADFHIVDWPVALFAGYGGAYSDSSNTQAFTAGVRLSW